MSNKKVSIIVPIFNEETRINKCIDSLLNQTYKDVEIIAINDGSTDNTLKILESYTDDRLKVYTIKNSGQGHARNIGIRKSNGKYITFVDADDYVDVNMIKLLYENIEKEKSDIAVCDLYKVYNEKMTEFSNYNNYFDNSVINFMISHSGPVGRLYKKDLFIDNNIYFLENCIYEDLATIPLLGIYAKKVSYINKYLYYYVIRDSSSMNQLIYSKKLEDIFKVMKHLKKEFTDRSKDNFKDVLEYLFIEHLLYSANIRFLKFKEGKKQSKYISNYFKTNFPLWRNNSIYKLKSIKFKLFCNLAFNNCFKLCKIFIKISKK